MRSRLPKVLHALAGRPLLDHVLQKAQNFHPERIHVVVGHGADSVRARFPDPSIHWVHQEQQQGTGHAVFLALSSVPGDKQVLVLYGDVPLIALQDLEACLQSAYPVCVIGASHSDPAGYGRLILSPTGELLRIVEEKDASPAERALQEINTGILRAPAGPLQRWLLRAQERAVQRKSEWYLTDVIAEARQENIPVGTVMSSDSGTSLGINDRQQLAEQERRFQRLQAEKLLQAGLQLADPERFDLRGTLQFGLDCVIDINVVMEGEILLGDDVHIGPGCVLRNVRIGNGTQIQAHSVLENCEVGTDCRIGPFSRLRPGSRLKKAARVGNFVEIKNTTLGESAKVNHLSYVGDSEVGARANLGAGTITCNYDGVEKHRTWIGEDAFIGSNSALVAPISIGDKSTVGAGSVLTRDVPAETLAIARPPQTLRENWVRSKPKR